MCNPKISFVVFLFLLHATYLFSAWQIDVNIALEDNDLKGDVSLGLRSDHQLAKKMYLDKAVIYVGYRSGSGIFLDIVPDFKEETSMHSKTFKESMARLVPLLLQQAYTKTKESHIQWHKEVEQDLNVFTEKTCTDEDVDTLRIESSVMGAVILYHEDLMTRTDMITMYAIVQKALEKVLHAQSEHCINAEVSQKNGGNKGSLRFYDTLQVIYQQRMESKEKALAEKIKKLKELRNIIKTYC